MPIKTIVTGAKGRMGQSVLACAADDKEFEIVAALDRDDRYNDHLKPGVVIVDFSVHTFTPTLAAAAQAAGCPMVIGTTGFTYAERTAIKSASNGIPIVMAPNMSVGVNLLFTLAHVVTSVLKEGYDIEIVEKHHRRKKDAPSGTASHLAEIIAETKGLQHSKIVKHGRFGDMGERTASEIGIHSIRAGDYVGDHTVIFANEGEVIEITHKAHSRDIFAKGALLAVKWVSTAQPGIYDMADVLGLQVSRRTE